MTSVQRQETVSQIHQALAWSPASTSRTSRAQKSILSCSFNAGQLDRVNVLGALDKGHTGCVNALSWAKNGEVLISGGDDRTLRLWRMDPADSSLDYPFACQSVIRTGHTANIFNAQMLPHSARIASVAGDDQVRVFDIGDVAAGPCSKLETVHDTRQSCRRVLRCHEGRVKRIVTENSPDLFLTVAEDGTVRQHDLRTPHTCSTGACPTPLVRLPHDLSALALSPLTPYQFVVAGESPYGYLFDRRQTSRILKEEWGVPLSSEDITTCIRRFGRKSRAQGERRGQEHVTGARMASSNGHEVLLSYSSDSVYLYSTYDEPTSKDATSSPLVPPNQVKASTELPRNDIPDSDNPSDPSLADELMIDDLPWAESIDDLVDQEMADETGSEDHISDDDDDDQEGAGNHDGVPVVLPQRGFCGHCNVETVKDVNFLGPNDEYVTSGSDDGNLFIWQKSTGKLQDILEGDASVVNVIESHPYQPLIAVSGIDTTVKLFAPVRGARKFSRFENASSITDRNAQAARQSSRGLDLANLFLHYERALRARGATDEDNGPECRNQ